jgi:TetR/AcrR family transcriptional repressor of nem operon
MSDSANLIVKTAHKLMSERGYSAFSYADIAERIPLRKPSIHHHFPTKASLVVTVLQQYRGQLIRATERLDNEFSNPLDRLRSIANRWETCIRDRSESFCVVTLLGAELPALPPEVGNEVKFYFGHLGSWLTKVFTEGRRSGSLSFQGSPRIEAEGFIATLHGAMLSARVYDDCSVYHDVMKSTLNRISNRIK